MTYLVLEVHLSYCIVVDETGRFLKIANLRYEVGQYIENVVELKAPEKTPKKFQIAALGSVAACFFLLFSLYRYQYMLPFGMIYLSVNPDVQIEINRQDTIVGLTGLNEDGELLVAGYKFRGKHTADAIDGLMDRAIELGFLSDGDTVVIRMDAPNDEWLVENSILLRRQLETHLADKAQVKIIIEIYDAEKGLRPPVSSSSVENTSSKTSSTSISSAPSTSSHDNERESSGDDSGRSNIQAPEQSSPPDNPQINNNNNSPQGGNSGNLNANHQAPVVQPLPPPPQIQNNSPPGDNDSGYGNDSGYS